MFRAFFFRRPVTLKFAATRSLPRGGGLGRGHSPEWRQLFSISEPLKIQALRLVALSLTLSHGREDGAAVGIKGSLCRLLFTFQTTCINGCKPKLPFKSPKSPNPLQPAPSPVGEGWGEGIPRISVTFPNTPTAPNTSLAACCPLSSSLPRERGRGSCWG